MRLAIKGFHTQAHPCRMDGRSALRRVCAMSARSPRNVRDETAAGCRPGTGQDTCPHRIGHPTFSHSSAGTLRGVPDTPGIRTAAVTEHRGSLPIPRSIRERSHDNDAQQDGRPVDAHTSTATLLVRQRYSCAVPWLSTSRPLLVGLLSSGLTTHLVHRLSLRKRLRKRLREGSCLSLDWMDQPARTRRPRGVARQLGCVRERNL